MAKIRENLAVIPAKKARVQFGELLDKAFYQGREFLIVKKNKPMAVLVGAPVWQQKTQRQHKAQQKITFGAYHLGTMKGTLKRVEIYAQGRPRLA